LREWPFDAPVVGQIEAAPIRVGETGRLRASRVALEKFPSEVERVADARRCTNGLGVGLAGGIQRRYHGRCSQRAAQQAAAGNRIVWIVHNFPLSIPNLSMPIH